MSRKIQELNEQQLRAIELLVAGHTVTETAEEVGVARETVSRWRSQDPLFMSELSGLQDLMWEASADRLRASAVKATKALEELIEHKDPAVRLKAIALSLKSLQALPRGGHVRRQSVNSVEKSLYYADL